MDLFNIETFKVKIKALMLVSVLAPAFSFTSNLTAQEDASTRVPTEELVEGIKSRDGRWFEVEMIIFKRTDNVNLREQFSQNVKSLTKRRQWDLVRDLLQPDISLLLAGLPECHQDKNPLANINPDAPLSPQEFYTQMSGYQELINNKWQFTNELCLMPSESLSGYWQLVNNVPLFEKPINRQVPLDVIPTKVTAGDHDDFHNVYVLAEQNLQLTSHFNKLKKNPNTEPMLHIGWRQPGLSKRESRPVYLVAGHNYTERFRYDGSEKLIFKQDMDDEPETTPLENVAPDLNNDVRNNVTNFMKKLQSGAVVDFKNSSLIYPKQNALPDETWQLDGFIQVHLDHYLYLEGQFNFRELSQEVINPEQFLAKLTEDKAMSKVEAETSTDVSTQVTNEELVTINYLKNYNFKQTRKSYSGDLHYLDHPKMGILIQIRKYRH